MLSHALPCGLQRCPLGGGAGSGMGAAGAQRLAKLTPPPEQPLPALGRPALCGGHALGAAAGAGQPSRGHRAASPLGHQRPGPGQPPPTCAGQRCPGCLTPQCGGQSLWPGAHPPRGSGLAWPVESTPASIPCGLSELASCQPVPWAVGPSRSLCRCPRSAERVGPWDRRRPPGRTAGPA